MPCPKVLRSWIIDHRKTMNYGLGTHNCKPRGFTLVELLVVIAILAITTSLITASYVSFERKQRLASAAQTLVSDIRLTQNKALSGDKSTEDCKTTDKKLVGWFIRLDSSDPRGQDIKSSYSIYSLCSKDGVEPGQNNENPRAPDWSSYKTYNFPESINLVRFKCNEVPSDDEKMVILHILFETLKNDVRVFAGFETPPFNKQDGTEGTRRCKGGDLGIILEDKSGNSQKVTVLRSGAVQ